MQTEHAIYRSIYSIRMTGGKRIGHLEYAAVGIANGRPLSFESVQGPLSCVSLTLTSLSGVRIGDAL